MVGEGVMVGVMVAVGVSAGVKDAGKVAMGAGVFVGSVKGMPEQACIKIANIITRYNLRICNLFKAIIL
jgi:hypothetical protein